MEDEYLELEMDQQEHFHQPSVPKEHSGRAEVGEDGAHYGVSQKEKGTRSKSVENMNLKKAKEVNQDIGTIKTTYLKNQEEFIHETGFPEFYTQQEHTENWFHTTRINGLGDVSFLSQG
ncbi:hypothetical protein DY000_02002837 [Brassica cretica]|uniref:Uncharacterized protein n=1 Tax=Brassica cretica TaxID=69181 RepID=A0ABQ7C2S9_BRACR|nr:hypothetical protein DY000_02002837 [Brassica cretica]